MSEIRVTFAALEAAQTDVTGVATRMASRLEDLERFLGPLVATWDGQAAADYQVKQRQWDAAAANLTTVLGQIGAALAAANESYRRVEQANAARWR